MIGVLVSCSPSTQITKSWSDPSLTPGNVKPFKKILVIARIKDMTSNRIAEDKIVSEIKNSIAVPSYDYLQTGDAVRSKVDAKVKKDGFDGLIVMKLTEVNKSLD